MVDIQNAIASPKDEPQYDAVFLDLMTLATRLATTALEPSTRTTRSEAQRQELVDRLGELEDVVKTCRAIIIEPVQDVPSEPSRSPTIGEWDELQPSGSDSNADSMPRRPSNANGLPLAAIRRVFEVSIPPGFLLNPAFATVPKSLWVQTMQRTRALSSIAKAWNDIGTEFLYNHICIWRIQQLPLLVRSLINNATLRSYVESLTFYALVEPKHEYDAFASLATLFSASRKLTTLNFASPWPLPEGMHLPPLPARVVRLRANTNINPEWFFQFLDDSSNDLASLSLPEIIQIPDNELEFSSLVELECIVSTQSLPGILEMSAKWSFPYLHRLTLHLSTSNLSPAEEDILGKFCKAVGSTVQYLHFHPSNNGDSIHCLNALLSYFPDLEHLVLHPRTVGDLSHPKVKWIDTWSPQTNNQATLDAWDETYSKLNKTRFPSLKGRRTIASSLLHLQDLPWDLAPDSVTSRRSPALSFEYEGFHVRHEYGRIVVASEPEWDDEEESDSGPFESSSDSEVNDGDDQGGVEEGPEANDTMSAGGTRVVDVDQPEDPEGDEEDGSEDGDDDGNGSGEESEAYDDWWDGE